MARYLVTGGAGRLGRSVVHTLAQAGHQVVSVDRGRVADLSAEQVEHDLTDAAATLELFRNHRPDGVVHLAGISVPFSAPDAETLAANVLIGESVLAGCRAAQVPALLISSSPTVIGYGAPAGWTPRALPLDEDHPLTPWNAYAVSKVALEQLAAASVRAGDPLRVGVFRPCYVISPEEWAGAPTQQGHTVADRLADPSLAAVSLFNYLDARDAGDFVLIWFERQHQIPNGTVFFVGAPDSLVDEPVGPALAREVPATADLAAGLAPDAAVFSSARAERLLGWRATRTWRDQLTAYSHHPSQSKGDDVA